MQNVQIARCVIFFADYINKILNRYDFKGEYTKQKVEEIRKIANEYVKRHAKQNHYQIYKKCKREPAMNAQINRKE